MTPLDPLSPTPPVPPAAAPPKAGTRGRRLARYMLVFLTTLVLVDAIVGENGLLTLLHKRRAYAALERTVQQARDDNAALVETARRLREDPAAIEAEARRELNLIKPGEKLFIIKDAKPHP